jgi:hypothetical protein
LLGRSGVLARTKFGVHAGKAGQVMDFVKGTSLKSEYESRSKSELRDFYRSRWKVVRDLQHLQMIDYITGQLDRHYGNIMISGSRAIGIDHDFSFGSVATGSISRLARINGQVHNKGLPQFITKQFARKIKRMKPEKLEKQVKGKILPAEVAAVKNNLVAAQTAIDAKKVVQLDNKPQAWLNALNQIDPNNSYLYGYEPEKQSD